MAHKRDVETCFNYCDTQTPPRQAFFSSDEQRWINKIRKLATQYPDDCVILKQPEDNFGCIYCKLPPSWLKVIPKRNGPVMTEERLEAAKAQLNRIRQTNNKQSSV